VAAQIESQRCRGHVLLLRATALCAAARFDEIVELVSQAIPLLGAVRDAWQPLSRAACSHT